MYRYFIGSVLLSFLILGGCGGGGNSGDGTNSLLVDSHNWVVGSWKAIGVDGEPIPAGSKEKINMVIRSDGTYRIDLWDKLGIHSWSEGTWETYDSNEYTGEILFTRINGDNGPCNSDCDFDLDFELVGDRQFMQIWIEDEEELQVITFKRTSPVPQASPEPKQQREVRGVVRNSDGIPILNVTVSVDALGDSPAVLTNDKGQFTIKVPAGRQQLKFEKAGYKELKVWVEANQTEVGPIYLENALPPRTVTGVVVNQEGSPLEGVEVICVGVSSFTLTDSAGRFSIAVPAGTQTLGFEDKNGRRVFVIIDADQTTLDIRVTIDQLQPPPFPM